MTTPKVIAAGHRFGPGLDLNGNPRPGINGAPVAARPADTFDRSSVKAGVMQVWVDAEGGKYTPVQKLAATDTKGERFLVSCLSPAGEVLPEREMAASAFAILRIESDPSAKQAVRRDRPLFGAEKRLVKAGVVAPTVLAQCHLNEAEICAALGKAGAILGNIKAEIENALVRVGQMPWAELAGGLMQLGEIVKSLGGDMVNVAHQAESLALRDVDANDAVILGMIATRAIEGPVAGEAMTVGEMVETMARVLGPASIAGLQSRLGGMLALGWVKQGGGDATEARICAGPRMFDVLFEPLAADGAPAGEG